MKRYIHNFSKYTFYVGVLVSLYGLYRSFVSRIDLEPGTCPIEDNRPIIYIGITLLLISLVLDLIDSRNTPKQ